jgi:hypothetical protein
VLGPLIALLGLMGLMVLWLFYTFQPKIVNRRQLFIFNNMAVGLCVVLGLLWYWRTHVAMVDTINEKYMQAVGIGGALAIEIVLLLLFMLMRNFWIFKPPKRF